MSNKQMAKCMRSHAKHPDPPCKTIEEQVMAQKLARKLADKKKAKNHIFSASFMNGGR